MLETIRRGQRWLTALLVGGVGFVFVVVFGNQGPGNQPTGGPTTIVELGDFEVDLTEFDLERDAQVRRLRAQLGDQFDESAASEFLNQQVMRLIVERTILAQSARELGLEVPKAEIQRFMRDNYKSSDGSFDEDAIVAAVERTYGTQRNFLEAIERDLLAQKMNRLLVSQANVSESELESIARQIAEEVQLAYVALSTESLPAGEEPSEEAVADWRSAHEAEIRARYDENVAQYTTLERVRARHILFRLDRSADEAAVATARDEAEEARARIVAGASFADVAGEVSEDDATRANGGELGTLSRAEMAGAVADAAFDLAPGQPSEVLRGERGFHIVLVEEKLPGGTRTFEEIAPELALAGARAEAAKLRAERLASELAEAVRAGASLESAARERDLTLARTGSLRRRPDSYVQDLGAAPEVVAAAFALTPGASSPRIFEVGNRLVLIQVLSKTTPSDAELAAQATAIREAALEQKRGELVSTWIREAQARFESEGALRVNASLVTGS